MYSASILSKETIKGVLRVIVQFSNGTDTFNEEFATSSGLDANWLKKAVSRRLDDLNSLSAIDTTPGAFDPTVTDPTPTQAESDRKTYSQKLIQLRRMTALQQLGIIAANDATVTSLKTWLKDNYKPNYLDQA